jgi:uncharacterized membrane protein
MHREQLLNRSVGKTLRVGISGSAALILVGFLMVLLARVNGLEYSFAAQKFEIPFRNGFTPETLLDPVPWFMSGLIVLMLTPIVRVLVALAGFVLERDWNYVIISTIVFVVLCTSVIVAFLG